ncbi:MAG: HAMP domain-containing sensor histidine kinase [Saprospiraceae bacterium]
MDLYDKKSRWKIYLAAGGALILLVSLFYTRFLAKQLTAQVLNQMEVTATAWQEIVEGTSEDVTLANAIIALNKDIPAMIVNDKTEIIGAINFKINDTQSEYLKRQLAKIKKKGPTPIKVGDFGAEIYYKYPRILTQLQYFPIIQLLLIAFFIVFGYMTFSSARRAEQNRVWVGMAKETAHQLGTPISGIVAWIEHLRLLREDDEEVGEILDELGNDVQRLDLIADRFSKIGSEPKLESVNIFDELESSRAYMQRRASRKIIFNFPDPASAPLKVNINSHLFNWVIENLLRNALDAMGPKGSISAEVTEENNFINIDLTDTGKGIPASKHRAVFQPGFTTKKRGWGLGLSLAKRIVEEYHSGKIFVKKSEENVGTTFSIKLPKG